MLVLVLFMCHPYMPCLFTAHPLSSRAHIR
uniref:Uncharacterized protein n=1 Tax=Arundo donax TaxID=35708 RepID=A0A0A8XXF1_ARUDO